MTKEFLEVLLKVQSEMPVVEKTTQAYNYKYAPIEHIWKEVANVLQTNGFAITNEVTSEGLKTTAHHQLGELTSCIPFSTQALEPQKKGSELTYYRRYNLTAIFNIIVAGEDDDAQSTKTATTTTVADPTDQWDDKPITDLGVCKDCGSANTTYKSGKVGCSKYCWRK